MEWPREKRYERLENLPKEKYHFIDAANVLVEPLSEDEMREILQKAKA